MLGIQHVLPDNYYVSDEQDNYCTGEMQLRINPADHKTLLLHLPSVPRVVQTVRSWQGVYYHRAGKAWILPATVTMVQHVQALGAATGMKLEASVPSSCLHARNAPMQKK